MTLLIRGVTMPKDRQLCIAIDEGHIFYKHPSENEWHMSDDSLVEIPPHGRLVDTDVVIDRIDMNIDLYGADFPITHARMRSFIEHAPTFMDAEE